MLSDLLRRPRPIRKAALPYGMYLVDPQQEAPAGWCPNCGAEIYAEDRNLCNRCTRSVVNTLEGGENNHDRE